MLKKIFKINALTRSLNALFSDRVAKTVAIAAASILITACTSDPYSANNTTGSSTVNRNTNTKDIWQRVRNGYQIPDLYNDEVTNKEAYYTQRADYFGRMAVRSGDFLYLILNEVERRRMPTEIALLPFVESAFVTTAASPVKASGLWQFMPATGKDFSLQQNHYADQRNDVVASTDAALTFLQRLHDQFGDWQLALAAYNWGPGNVSKAVKRNIASGGSGTYSEIRMPLETRQYVPKLQAIKNIVTHPERFGLVLPTIDNSIRHEAVTVTRDIDVYTAARLAGMSLADFKRLNPAHKKPVIAAVLGSKILVPTDHASDLRSAFSNRSQQLASLTTYSTYNTVSLQEIATQYKTDVDNLRALNNIPSNHDYVKGGSTLLVPRVNNSDEIPYEALTARLTTTSSGFGLANEVTEYPEYTIASNGSRETQEERSGIVKPTSGTTLTALHNSAQDDDLGGLIKSTPSVPSINTVSNLGSPSPIAPTIFAQIPLSYSSNNANPYSSSSNVSGSTAQNNLTPQNPNNTEPNVGSGLANNSSTPLAITNPLANTNVSPTSVSSATPSDTTQATPVSEANNTTGNTASNPAVLATVTSGLKPVNTQSTSEIPNTPAQTTSSPVAASNTPTEVSPSTGNPINNTAANAIVGTAVAPVVSSASTAVNPTSTSEPANRGDFFTKLSESTATEAEKPLPLHTSVQVREKDTKPNKPFDNTPVADSGNAKVAPAHKEHIVQTQYHLPKKPVAAPTHVSRPHVSAPEPKQSKQKVPQTTHKAAVALPPKGKTTHSNKTNLISEKDNGKRPAHSAAAKAVAPPAKSKTKPAPTTAKTAVTPAQKAKAGKSSEKSTSKAGNKPVTTNASKATNKKEAKAPVKAQAHGKKQNDR